MKMYYVVEPLNTNYRAGDSGGDWTINSAPEADYYTNLRKATAAAKKTNRELLSWMEKGYNDKADILAEQGAFVVHVVWNPVS